MLRRDHRILVSLVCATLSCGCSHLSADRTWKGGREALTAYVGEWKNEDLNSRNIARVIIALPTDRPDNPSIHVWGKCGSRECDLGLLTGARHRNAIVAISNDRFATSTLTLSLQRDGHLNVDSQRHFSDSSGRP